MNWYEPESRDCRIVEIEDEFGSTFVPITTWEDLEYDIAQAYEGQLRNMRNAETRIFGEEPPAYHNGAWTLLELPSLVSL